MGKRLDVNDPKIIEIIESKYSKKKDKAMKDASTQCENLISTIEFYKSHSYDEVYNIKMSNIKKKYDNMNNKTALRNATILAFEKKGKTDVPENEIQSIMKKITPSAANSIINKYKAFCFEKEMESFKSEYAFFTSIPDEEIISFSGLYQELYLSESLYYAKEKSIKETAVELNVDVPLCLSNNSAIDTEAERIINISDANEEEKTFISKFREKCDKIYDYLEENEKDVVLSTGLSGLTGACSFLAYINQKADLAPAVGTAIISSSLMLAILLTLYNSYDIKCFFEDKKTVAEAKKLGLLDLFINFTNVYKEYNSYKEKYDSAKKEEKGGTNNGLH